MKTLFVLRHAKSSWNDSAMTDFERPLNERGFRAAPLIGETMKRNGFLPELIVSSPAKRAAQTAELIKKSAEINGEIRFDKRIYEADSANLLEVLAEQNNLTKSVLLIGHNPGLEHLIYVLTGEMHPMPTAALAVIDLETSVWSELKVSNGNLRTLIRPKELK